MLLHVVDGPQLGMGRQQLFQALALLGVEPVVALAQDAQPGPIPAELRPELAGDPREQGHVRHGGDTQLPFRTDSASFSVASTSSNGIRWPMNICCMAS